MDHLLEQQVYRLMTVVNSALAKLAPPTPSLPVVLPTYNTGDPTFLAPEQTISLVSKSLKL